jgi:hypothetical protein
MSVREGDEGRSPWRRVPFFALVFLLSFGVTHIHAAWADELRLTYDAAESRTCANNGWSLASAGQGRVSVVWHDYRTGCRFPQHQTFAKQI